MTMTLISKRLRTVALALPAIACILSSGAARADSGGISDAWIMTMLRRHCMMCHSENPSHTTLLSQRPPKGVVLESIEDITQFAPRVKEMVVRRRFMPFGNETAMTESDRDKFGQWIDGLTLSQDH
jgi:uncharacterized membrane protein